MRLFTQQNTDDYTDAQIDALNAEWECIVTEKNLEPGTDEYDVQAKWFCDLVARR